MKLVVVSQRVDVFPEREETRDALDQRLLIWLSLAGFVPVPVPNSLGNAEIASHANTATSEAWLQRIKPEAILLSGGNDVGSCNERDLTETCLLNYAKSNRLPVLGICRGMQMMGVWAGGELRPVSGHVRTRHSLVGVITGEANSYHGLALKECPPGFHVLAQSEDREIEAIRHNDLPWEGWMWHPEREADFHARDTDRVRRLFGCA